MKIVYEHSFDWNEWFIISILVLTILWIWILPKIFPLLESIAYYLYGISISMLFDHTISVPPWDFYDVNDSSAYTIMDFLSYVSFGPFSYLFLYFYVRLKISGFMNILYVIIWTLIALIFEWIGLKIGYFHYDKGYKMYWSAPIYLFVQTALILIFQFIQKSKTPEKTDSP